MINAHLGLLPILAIYFLNDAVMVFDQSGDGVIPKGCDLVPAMIAEVIDHKVKIIGEEGPEGIVEVNRQPVPVTNNQSRTLRVAVASKDDNRTVFHLDIMSGKRRRYLPSDCRFFQADLPAPGIGAESRFRS